MAFFPLVSTLPSLVGPLNALVGLMQEKNEPLPGLLYEAEIQTSDSRPVREALGSNLRGRDTARRDTASRDTGTILRGGGDRALETGRNEQSPTSALLVHAEGGSRKAPPDVKQGQIISIGLAKMCI